VGRRSGDALGGDLELNWVAERCTLELGDLGGHRRREEVGVSLLPGDDFEDVVDDRSKVEVEQPVSLVHDLYALSLAAHLAETDGERLTKYLKVLRLNPFVFSRWSCNRPGVATTM
jgi:hypothetical protein